MEERNRPAVTGVSLGEFEKQIVLAESDRRGLYNFSAALRQIVREWAEMKSKGEQPKPDEVQK